MATKDIAEMTHDELIVDYISEIRHHIGTGDIETAEVILDLLEEFITGDIPVLENEDMEWCEEFSTGLYFNNEDDGGFFENVW